MNSNDLRHLSDELRKMAGVGRLAGKLFKRSKVPTSKRIETAGKDLLVSSGIVGAIGVGGLGYGSFKHGSPLSEKIMNRGQY